MPAVSSTNNRNTLEETDDKFYFPPGSLLYGKENVITILQVSLVFLKVVMTHPRCRTIWASTSRVVSRVEFILQRP